jgi:hypothetical protein
MSKKHETSITSLIDLPYESLCGIAQYLLPKEVLNFISIHPSFVPLLCHSKQFWLDLKKINYGTHENCSNNDIVESSTYNDSTSIMNDWAHEKYIYIY